MTTPDQHTSYVAETSGLETAIRFHLTSRVFPYWSNEHVTRAMPVLLKAVGLASDGDWDAEVTWVYPGDGSTREVTVGALFEGLNLWGLENA